MNKSYPISKSEKEVLNFVPKQDSCMWSVSLSCLKNQIGEVVFLWLKNGSGFWYRILSERSGILSGFMMSKNQWKRYNIPLSDIQSYY